MAEKRCTVPLHSTSSSAKEVGSSRVVAPHLPPQNLQPYHPTAAEQSNPEAGSALVESPANPTAVAPQVESSADEVPEPVPVPEMALATMKAKAKVKKAKVKVKKANAKKVVALDTNAFGVHEKKEAATGSQNGGGMGTEVEPHGEATEGGAGGQVTPRSSEEMQKLYPKSNSSGA